MVQKRVEKMEKSGQKWAQEGAGRKKADQDRELENIVRGYYYTTLNDEHRVE